jgi:hypothetical protein
MNQNVEGSSGSIMDKQKGLGEVEIKNSTPFATERICCRTETQLYRCFDKKTIKRTIEIHFQMHEVLQNRCIYGMA